MLIAMTLGQLETADILPHDVHDANGRVIALRGARLTHGLKDRLASETTLFKPSALKELRHEGTVYQLPSSSPSIGVLPKEDDPERTSRGIIQTERAQTAIRALKMFWQQLAEGKAADIALAEIARDQLIADLNNRLDAMRYINQLRVRDGYTYDHTLDVASMSVALAIRLGHDTRTVREIGLGALLHDLGKLLIPRQIMFKAGRLSEAEFQVMKLHPELGYRILHHEMKLPDPICRPALEHQEMYGGGGYPYNLRGDEIHPYSHIVKIADVYDALTSRRPYKEPIPSQKALDIMLAEGGRGFNPQMLATFAELANYKPVPASVGEPAQQVARG